MRRVIIIAAATCLVIPNLAGRSIPAELRIILLVSSSVLFAVGLVMMILELRRKAKEKKAGKP